MNEQLSAPAEQTSELTTTADVSAQLIKPLALRAMFMRPAYLEPSAWLEHVPFAFWLIEALQPRVLVELGTHHGTSYFAFCQAVERLGLDTRCFAIDTWKGDEHAGFYDEDVFEKVRSHNEEQYSGFSRLVRSTFDEALDHFSDGTVDLLHVDGLHTLQAVQHDFDSWLPKLSERAVVVLHDTNVRERNFGVFKLIEKLRQKYPCFEFVHGHGLGIVGVGEKPNERMRCLFSAQNDTLTRHAIHDVFGRLGRACADALTVRSTRTELGKLRTRAQDQQSELKKVRAALETTRSETRERAKELNDARSKLRAQAEQHAKESGQQSERIRMLEALHAELKAEFKDLKRAHTNATDDLTKVRVRLAAADKRIADCDERMRTKEALNARLERERTDAKKTSEQLNQALRTIETESSRLRTENAELSSKLHARFAEIADLTRILQQAQSAQGERDRLLAERDRLSAELGTRTTEVAELKQLLRQAGADHANKLVQLRAELAAERGRLEELTEQLQRQIEQTRHLAASEIGRIVTNLMQQAPRSWRGSSSVSRRTDILRRSGIVDGSWYLRKYPDVRSAGADPVVHYLRFGAGEGREPNRRLRANQGPDEGEGEELAP